MQKVKWMGAVITAVSAVVIASSCVAEPPPEAAGPASGIAVGQKVSSYSATKCAGVDEGIPVGKSLCFT
jgi:hypothetical protein